ncbi:hypothetical protein BGW80DRAFT_1255996 [Lactifluus volemus]|nr:hypothetical protein BGW80DRAFT_1255996 [Lactifluus volemus]
MPQLDVIMFGEPGRRLGQCQQRVPIRRRGQCRPSHQRSQPCRPTPATQSGFQFRKNRYFFDDEEKICIGPRIWALMGFYSSVRLGKKLLLVNINRCKFTFHEPGKLSDAICAFSAASYDAIPREFMGKVKQADLPVQPTTLVLNAFGIQVTNQMIVVPGHELLVPSVTYGKGQLHVANGSWNILDIRFYQGARVMNWKVLVMHDGMEALTFKGPMFKFNCVSQTLDSVLPWE